jgi:outer membrane protein insertion porin family
MAKFRLAILLTLLVALTGSVLHAQTTSPISPRQKKLKIASSGDFVDGQTIIEGVYFTGLDPEFGDDGFSIEGRLFESDARMYMQRNKAEIQPDETFSAEKVEMAIIALKKFLSNKQYFSAKVTALGQKVAPDRMRITFAIDRGPIVGISDVQFTGNINFTREELVEALKDCMGESWGRYDLRYLDYCRTTNLRSLMFSRGYLESKVSYPYHRFRNVGFEIRFDIDEGVRYRWGELKIDGSKLFSSKEILEICGLKTGEVADGTALKDFVYERLKRLYADKGYIQYNAEFEPELIPPPAKGLDATINVQIFIDEGPAFKVRRINFDGIDSEKAKELINRFSLKAGELFSQTKLENDIEELNKSGEFRPIDKDQAVEFLADDETANLNLNIRLTPLDR